MRKAICGVATRTVRVTAVALAAAVGCSQYIDPNVPEPIHPRIEPSSGQEYLLYRPSGYDRRYAWPLVVVCHSSFPDSPDRQIRDWTQLAENDGFLVVAPKLNGVAAHFPPEPQEQEALQEKDAQRILATVRHVRAGHNVSPDRVFIHGWAGGAHAALFAGLSHPDRFRAISLIEPRFDAEYLRALEGRIDQHQPVFVYYDSSDALYGKHAQRCTEWLREHGADVHEDAFGPARRSDTQHVVQFFETVIRKIPWIRIRAFAVSKENPLELKFKLTCTLEPAGYHWRFGDGDESHVAEPIHAYSGPGTYHVSATVTDPHGRTHQRVRTVRVPYAP